MRHSYILALWALPLLAGCAGTPRIAPPRDGAKIVQTIAEFHRPESVAFDLDGSHLYVANCGSGLFGPEKKLVGFAAGQGAISKLAVDSEGRAKILKLRLADGLSGPLGLAFLPIATERYPRGTLLVNVGLALLVNGQGEPIRDAKQLGTGILFLDPETGRQLGKIDLGVGSAVAQAIGHPVLLNNSLAFDSRGNLYVTDTAKGGDRLSPPIEPAPGLIRIPHGSIDDPSRGGITFTSIPGVPNGVGYWPRHDSIAVVTMGGQTPEGEAVYLIPAGDFPLESLPEPHSKGVGTMDGIAFTPAGTILTSRFSGDILAIPEEGAPAPLRLDPDVPLVAPADHRSVFLPDGSTLLAVPEQARTEPDPWKQRVRLIRLPAGF